jgi:hypothetical protein
VEFGHFTQVWGSVGQAVSPAGLRWTKATVAPRALDEFGNPRLLQLAEALRAVLKETLMDKECNAVVPSVFRHFAGRQAKPPGETACPT